MDRHWEEWPALSQCSVNTIMIRKGCQAGIRFVVIHLLISAQTLDRSPAMREASWDMGLPVQGSVISGAGGRCWAIMPYGIHTAETRWLLGIAQDVGLGHHTHLAAAD